MSGLSAGAPLLTNIRPRQFRDISRLLGHRDFSSIIARPMLDLGSGRRQSKRTMGVPSKDKVGLRHHLAREIDAAYRKRGRELVLTVAGASFDRAIRLLDDLFVKLEAAGCEIRLSAQAAVPFTRAPPRGVVTVHGESMPFFLKERNRRQSHALTPSERVLKRQGHMFLIPRWDFVPTGEFCLTFEPPLHVARSWSDGRRGKLETKLDAVAEKILSLAEAVRSARQERDETLRRREQEAAEIAAKERRDREERKRVADLVAEARSWADARLVRSYVSAVRANSHATKRTADLRRWLAWAEKAADSLDPTNSRICGEWDAESE